jgi:glycosyltransferase involved in cell wall biosynthesis
MTAIARTGYKPVRKKTIFSPKSFSPQDVSIVMPVKDNLEGVQRFVSELLSCLSPGQLPGELVVVDNNSATPVELTTHESLQIVVIRCQKRGPAAARNRGVAHAKGKWILFCDSDCIPTADLLQGYQPHLDGSVGYAGWVRAKDKDLLSQYYDSQEILIPPHSPGMVEHRPEYLITCNALVWREAFEGIGGFNEDFPKAAGEDVDLGYRLREVGTLAYAEGSMIIHDFGDGLDGFLHRFKRYGEGNCHLQQLYPEVQLMPTPFEPNVKSITNFALAKLQYEAMLEGWEQQSQFYFSRQA